MFDKLPIVDFENDEQMSAILPPLLTVYPIASAMGAESIGKTLAPDEDWAPMWALYGWDNKGPAVTFASVEHAFYRDGASKDRLTKRVAGSILQRRNEGTETYAVLHLNVAWFAAVKPEPPKDGESLLHSVQKQIERFGRDGIRNEPSRVECLQLDLMWQDGQRIFMSAIERSPDAPPKLGPWRDISAGTALGKNRFWSGIAPTLAPMAYSEGLMIANGFFDASKKQTEKWTLPDEESAEGKGGE